jgi:multiple sugar transport system permease protein/sn-glycerol 3-phosphate transport system permease protein
VAEDLYQTTGGTTALHTRAASSRARRGNRAFVPYLYLLPTVLGTVIFIILPIAGGLALSLFHWNIIGPLQFVGLRNFSTMFGDPQFWHSLEVTIEYVILSVIPLIIASLGLAVLLSRKFPGASAFRTLAVLPYLATPVAISVIWEWIFDPQSGAINSALRFAHLPAPAWLTSPGLALPTVALVSVWQALGYNMLFFLAGLQGIPSGLYEAAAIDGAGAWKRFFKITLPLIRPTMLFVTVVNLIAGFQTFDTIYIMTNGGPGNATSVMNFSIYQNAFEFYNVGYAAAITVALTFIILIVTAGQFLYYRNRIVYDLG